MRKLLSTLFAILLLSATTSTALAGGLVGSSANDEEAIRKFWEACRNGNVDVVRESLAAGIDPDMIFEGGMTPLTTAAMRNQVGVIGALIEGGADLSKPDEIGKVTALGWAVDWNQADVVEYLLPRANADFEILLITGAARGNSGWVEAALKSNRSAEELEIALGVAMSRDRKEIIAMLKEAGATAPTADSPEALAEFAGTYRDESGTEMELEFRDDRLLAHGGPDDFFEQNLTPFGKAKLVIGGGSTNIIRFKDASGGGDGFTLNWSGTEYTYTRTGGAN